MIHICKSLNGQFYNRVVSKNGKIVATSELFKTRKSALKNIEAMKKIFGISANKAKTFIQDKTNSLR